MKVYIILFTVSIIGGDGVKMTIGTSVPTSLIGTTVFPTTLSGKVVYVTFVASVILKSIVVTVVPTNIVGTKFPTINLLGVDYLIVSNFSSKSRKPHTQPRYPYS